MMFGQTGDTIVEVLIAIAVVSLLLTAAYASANHNVAALQDTQEHTEALKLVQSQVELLRANGDPGGDCFKSSGVSGVGPDCIVDSNGTPNANGPFKLSIDPATTYCQNDPNSYAISATWDGLLGSTTPNNVTLCYRIVGKP